MTTKELLNSKPGKIAVLVFSITFGIWSFYGLVDLTRRNETRDVEREIAAATEQLHKSPPGIQRGQVFLGRLKAIDPGHAPAEVKQALRDYISALEKEIDASNARRDAKQYDAAMEEAQQRLTASMNKWD